MRTSGILMALITLVAIARPAVADESREQKRFRLLTERAERHLTLASSEDGPAATLRHLSRAVHLLERARKIDASTVRSPIVHALNETTRIHLDRRSIPRAERTNRRALAIDPRDAGALDLARDIARAKGVDLDDQFRGRVGASRLAERRSADGPAYRARGILRRR
jgi:hypothetical protein